SSHGSSRPAATVRTSSAGLWNTTQTSSTPTPTNQTSTAPPRARRSDDQEAVALRAHGDALLGRLALHRLDLGGGQGEVATGAAGAVEPPDPDALQARAERFVAAEQRLVDGRGEGSPALLQRGQLG